MDDPNNLIAPLAHWLAAGKLDVRLVLPAIQKLAGEGRKPVSLLMVLAGLEGETDEAFVNLASHLRDVLRREALRLYEKRKQREPISNDDSALLQGLSFDPAPEWNWPGDPATAMESVIRTTREIALLAGREQEAPQLFHEVKQRLSQNLAAAHAAIAPLIVQLPSLLKELDEAWPANLPGRNLITGLGTFTFASNRDVVADVQDWVRYPANNFGWILICELEDLEKSVRKFASSEYTFNTVPTNRPKLDVEFTLPLQSL